MPLPGESLTGRQSSSNKAFAPRHERRRRSTRKKKARSGSATGLVAHVVSAAAGSAAEWQIGEADVEPLVTGSSEAEAELRNGRAWRNDQRDGRIEVDAGCEVEVRERHRQRRG